MNALTEQEKSHLIKVVWGNIANEYCRRQLSFESDRLVALSAISHRVKLTNDGFLAGLWRSALFLNLLWSSWGGRSTKRRRLFPGPSQGPVSSTQATYVAPSWSWASAMGKIVMKGEELKLSKHAKILSATVRPVSEKNPFGQVEPGATVRIASRIRHGGRTGSPSESSDNESTESGNSQAFVAIENTYLC